MDNINKVLFVVGAAVAFVFCEGCADQQVGTPGQNSGQGDAMIAFKDDLQQYECGLEVFELDLVFSDTLSVSGCASIDVVLEDCLDSQSDDVNAKWSVELVQPTFAQNGKIDVSAEANNLVWNQRDEDHAYYIEHFKIWMENRIGYLDGVINAL